jgi:hypothetical protein
MNLFSSFIDKDVMMNQCALGAPEETPVSKFGYRYSGLGLHDLCAAIMSWKSVSECAY